MLPAPVFRAVNVTHRKEVAQFRDRDVSVRFNNATAAVITCKFYTWILLFIAFSTKSHTHIMYIIHHMYM